MRRTLLFYTFIFFTFVSSLSAERTYQFDHFQAVNVDKVTEQVYRGGQPHLDDYDKLKDLGIKTIINFKADEHPDERFLVDRAGLEYVHIPWKAHGSGKGRYDFSRIAEEFLAVVENSEKLPAYVHCHLGRDRTGAMFAIYRMKHFGWSADQALEEMLEFGFRPEDYSNLVEFVYGWEANEAAA